MDRAGPWICLALWLVAAAAPAAPGQTALDQDLGLPDGRRASTADERAWRDVLDLLDQGRDRRAAAALRTFLLGDPSGLLRVENNLQCSLDALAQALIVERGPDFAAGLTRSVGGDEQESLQAAVTAGDLTTLAALGRHPLLQPLGVAARLALGEHLLLRGRIQDALANARQLRAQLPPWHADRAAVTARLAYALGAVGDSAGLEQLLHDAGDDPVTSGDTTRPVDQIVRGLLLTTAERLRGRPTSRPAPNARVAPLAGIGERLSRAYDALPDTPVLFADRHVHFLSAASPAGLSSILLETGKLVGRTALPPGDLAAARALVACGRPDRIAVVSAERVLLVNPMTGELLGEFPGSHHTGPVAVGATAVCVDGTLLVVRNTLAGSRVPTHLEFIDVERAAAAVPSLKLWVGALPPQPKTRNRRGVLQPPSLPTPALAATGTIALVATGTGAVVAVDLHSQAPLWVRDEPPARRLQAAAMAPVIAGGFACVWPVDAVAPLRLELATGRRRPLAAGRFKGDGLLLPAGGRAEPGHVLLADSSTLRLLDLTTGQALWDGVRWPRGVLHDKLQLAGQELLATDGSGLHRLDLVRGRWFGPDTASTLQDAPAIHCSPGFVALVSQQGFVLYRNAAP